MQSDNKGFTLIELTLVFFLIGIVAAIAIPNYQAYRDRACRAEGYALADSVRKTVLEYRDIRGVFPEDNQAAGLPEPRAINGKYVRSIAVDHGIITAIIETHTNIISLRLIPIVNEDYPTGPVLFKDSVSVVDPKIKG